MVSLEERIRSLEHRLRVLQKLAPMDQGRTHLSGVVLPDIRDPSAATNSTSELVAAAEAHTDGGTAAQGDGMQELPLSQENLIPSGRSVNAAEAVQVTPRQPPASHAKPPRGSPSRSPAAAPESSPKKIKYMLRPKKPKERAAEKAEAEHDEMSIIPKRKFRVVCKPKNAGSDNETKKKTLFSSTFTIRGSDLSPFDAPVESMYFVNKKKGEITRAKSDKKDSPKKTEKEKKEERRKFYPSHKFNVGLNPSYTDSIPVGGLAASMPPRAYSSTPTPTTHKASSPDVKPIRPASQAAPRPVDTTSFMDNFLHTAAEAAARVRNGSPTPHADTQPEQLPGRSPAPSSTAGKHPSYSCHESEKRAGSGVRLHPITPTLTEVDPPPSRGAAVEELDRPEDKAMDEYLKKHIAEDDGERPRSVFSARSSRGGASRHKETVHTHTEKILFDLDVAGEAEESARRARLSGQRVQPAAPVTPPPAVDETRPSTRAEMFPRNPIPPEPQPTDSPRGASAPGWRMIPTERKTTTTRRRAPATAAGTRPSFQQEEEHQQLVMEKPRVETEGRQAALPKPVEAPAPQPEPEHEEAARQAPQPPAATQPETVPEAPRAPVPPPVNGPEPDVIRPGWLDRELDEKDKVLYDFDSLQSRTEYKKLYDDYGQYLDGYEEGLLKLWDGIGGTDGWQRALRPAQLSLLLSQELTVKVRFRVHDDWLTYLGGTSIKEDEVTGFVSTVLSRLPHLEYVELFDCPRRPFEWSTVLKTRHPFPSLKGLYFLYTNWTSSDVLQIVQLCPGIEKGKIRTDTYMRCSPGLSADQLTAETRGKVLVRSY